MIINTIAVLAYCFIYIATLRAINRRIDKLSELAVKTAEAEVFNRVELKVVNHTNTFIMKEITSLQEKIRELQNEKISEEALKKSLSTGIPSCPEQHMACDKAGLC